MENQNPYETPALAAEPARAAKLPPLFSFRGRAPRLEYWLTHGGAFIGLMIFILGVGAAAEMLSGQIKEYSFWLMVPGILAYVWVTWAVTARRFHDRNKSGAWLLLSLLPYIGSFWILIECGFLEGTRGKNNYGSDPLQ